jgi:hypothetical protein
MMKKILFIIVLIVILLGILYSMGFLDNIVEPFIETRISIEEKNVIDMGSQKGDIILAREGYYIVYDNVLETYDYKGQMADIHEFDGFIEETFLGIRKFVKTVDSVYIELEGNFLEMEYDGEEKKLLNISQDERIFVVSSDYEETTNTVDIYDNSMKLLGTYDSERMRVIKTLDSDNSDGFIVTTFSYEGNYMTSKIGEYLVEGMYNLWELDLNNEVVVFQYTAKDGIYVATNENMYKINNDGSILWTYSGYEYIKDCKFVDDKIFLLTGKEKNSVTTIDTGGKVEGIIKTEDSYRGLDVYKGHVFLSNSSFISYIADEKVIMAYNPDGVIKDLEFSSDKIRLLLENSIVELSIKID